MIETDLSIDALYTWISSSPETSLIEDDPYGDLPTRHSTVVVNLLDKMKKNKNACNLMIIMEVKDAKPNNVVLLIINRVSRY